ncbi:hypothetical protein ASE68_16855 [Agromyces sp. Leaf222]|nr:hypothetical protein ASE68_16855 [Agromyces sp. Leaf222]
MRGLASVVVLLWHAFLIAQPHLADGLHEGGAAPGTPYWWLVDSPLSILIAGEQAVLVFFLLSGIVLTLPVIRTPRYNWVAYYPRRILRLYLPVVVSVVLAAILLIVVPRAPTPIAAWQWTDNAHSFDPLGAVTAAALVNPRPAINGPLWSLTWEMAFSLALPLFVLIAVRVGRWWIAAVIGAVLLVDLGVVLDISPLKFLPVFLIGALAAVNIDGVMASARRLSDAPRHRMLWSSVLLASTLLMTAFKASSTLLAPEFAWVTTVLSGFVIVGCMGLVFVSMGSGAARRVLESRSVQWTGRLSFSLYLVHVPLMIAISYAFGWDLWWLAILVSVPLSFALAAAFTKLVEQPAHTLSKGVGRTVDRWSRRHEADHVAVVPAAGDAGAS